MPFCYWSKFKYAYKYGFIILIFAVFMAKL